MRKRISLLACVVLLSTALVGCTGGEGKIAAKNLSSDKNDDGYYYVSDGIMRYDLDTKRSEYVIPSMGDDMIISNVYSFDKYLFYEVIDETDPKNWVFNLMYANKEKNYEGGLIYLSDDSFLVEAEGMDLIVTTGDETYTSPGALEDFSRLADESHPTEDDYVTDGSYGEYTLMDGTKMVLQITDSGELVYEIAGTNYMVEGLDAYDIDTVAIDPKRITEVDDKIVCLFTAGNGRGSKAFYDTVHNSDFKADMLVELKRTEGTGELIYVSTSPKERVVGYDGLFYIYKNGALYSSKDGKKLNKLMKLQLNSNVSYDFIWVGDTLVVFDTDSNCVVDSWSK